MEVVNPIRDGVQIGSWWFWTPQQMDQYFVDSPRVSGILGYLQSKEAVRGHPRWAQSSRARLGLLARPGGLCPPRWPPAPPLCSINTPIFQKPQGGRRKPILAAASSRTTRSILDTISEGCIMSIGASLMMREELFVDLRVCSQQLDASSL